MRRHLTAETVVVITGASSGIGRATALRFARRGVCLVLASREARALEPVVAQCVAAGGRAIAVETDTGDSGAARYLAVQAVSHFGRIDVWVNNAGVAAFGRFIDVSTDLHDEVIRTNLTGYVHGAHAAMKTFLAQGSGVLINVVSMAGWAPTPMAATYSATKFGNRGFSEALRIELAGRPDIKVCDVYPAFVDTPMLEHVANLSRRRLAPVPPVVSVDAVARRIVELAERPREFNPVGIAVPAAILAHSLTPRLFRWTAGRAIGLYARLAPRADATDGAVSSPSGGGPPSGGLRSRRLRALAVVSLGAVVAAVVVGLKRRARGR